MSLKNISNADLVKLIIGEPANDSAWFEFYKRFHRHICSVIYKESQKKYYKDGVAYTEDIAQDVYKILIKNDYKALRDFKGRLEKSIYKYLKIIGIRVVINRMKIDSARKRPPSKWKMSLDAPISEITDTALKEILPSLENEENIKLRELLEEIEFCLRQIAARRRQGNSYALIFKLRFFEDFEPEEIADQPHIRLSRKRIENVVTEVKKDLLECLQGRL